MVMVLQSCRRLRCTCPPPDRRRLALLRFGLVGAMLLLAAVAAGAEGNDFAAWLQGLRTEAQNRGIRATTLDAALIDLKPLPRVIELDRKQPETTLTYEQYVKRVLPQSRIHQGQTLLHAHGEVLKQIEAQYGVPPHVVVALWGIESDYGHRTGGFPTIAALATLAHDGRRGAYFRRELLHALQIIDEGHIAADQMTGSWAGAMGQSQFMPSSFLRYAVDFDGDGRRDIWTTLGDVFASTANYLVQVGWQQHEPWGQRVILPDALDPTSLDLTIQKSLGDWQKLGVRGAASNSLRTVPARQAALVVPSDGPAPAFLVFHNFHVFLRWNRSTYFALAVSQLSDHIRHGE